MAIGRLVKTTIRKFIKWIDSDVVTKEYSEPNLVYVKSSSNSSQSIRDGNNGMNFTVYHATGGKVIQFVTYDARTDRSRSELYVITDKEDLGEELGQIITRESLTR